MKTFFSIVLFSTFFLLSCSSPKPLLNTIEETVSDEMQQSNITRGSAAVTLYSFDNIDTLESSIDYAFYAHPILPYQDSVNRFIQKYITANVSFNGGTTDKSVELNKQFFEDAINTYADNYKAELSLIAEDEEPFGSVWSSETQVDIIEDKAEYVQVSIQNWDYSGGAHGNSWMEEVLIDIKTGRRLTIEDFFSDIGDLTMIAEDFFRIQQEIPDDVSITEAGFWFEDDFFRLNDNFSFNAGGVDFVYNQYEIAPYVAGIIYLSIPIERIKFLLKRRVD